MAQLNVGELSAVTGPGRFAEGSFDVEIGGSEEC